MTNASFITNLPFLKIMYNRMILILSKILQERQNTNQTSNVIIQTDRVDIIKVTYLSPIKAAIITLYRYDVNSNGPGPEQVVHTHRTS